MNAPEIKGWCPGALRPMLSGDGYVVRIRPFGSRLSQAQLRGIAALALAHGNGLIDLSTRANLQLRGVTEASHRPLIEGLRGLGLLDNDAGAEGRRNIVVAPFWQAGDGTEDLAALLAAALAAADAPDLPGKFGFALDPGPLPILRTTSADIRIERAGAGFLTHGDGHATGAQAATATEAVAHALTLARWFLDQGGAGVGRMARLRASLPAGFDQAIAAVTAPEPQPGPCAEGWLAAPEFGQLRAETLAALAAQGGIRMTPWRMLLLESPAAPTLPGLITTPGNPLRRVVACTGAPGCSQALQPTRALARLLAPNVPLDRMLHISGCAKGCAHPGLCDSVLTACPDGFMLARNAKAGSNGPLYTVENLIRGPNAASL
jgi:precorrin-3B synthase